MCALPEVSGGGQVVSYLLCKELARMCALPEMSGGGQVVSYLSCKELARMYALPEVSGGGQAILAEYPFLSAGTDTLGGQLMLGGKMSRKDDINIDINSF